MKIDMKLIFVALDPSLNVTIESNVYTNHTNVMVYPTVMTDLTSLVAHRLHLINVLINSSLVKHQVSQSLKLHP